MRSRFLPYATTPGRLLAQLISDITVAVWTTLWMLVGLAVHDAISIIGEAARQIEIGSHGIAGNLAAAGQDAQRIPVVGDALSNPITAASQAALDIAGAGHNLDTTAGWLAEVLALAGRPRRFLPWPCPGCSCAAVLPAQVDRYHPGGDPSRSPAAGAARIGEPAAGQTGRRQHRSGRRLATRGSRHHACAGRARVAGRRNPAARGLASAQFND
ncbi:transmembrane protein [Mycobacterium tuberculosis CAS/NITR204]|uniref:Transmembrane protein n=1 Tax=Mycobacterium tuberculosis CAS/NITR204 TaxID=1310114 RepID=R4M621_MYCTX|nr:transmembrane protein [Mycobacterium tuberculosis CAS/NITR204]